MRRWVFGVAAGCAACSIELAELQSPDAGPSGSGGVAGGAFGGADGGGQAGDASTEDVGDASDASDASDATETGPSGVLCSVDFEASQCFSAFDLKTTGNAHCGPNGAISGTTSGTLEGGNSTSMGRPSCSKAPSDLWFELVYRRSSNGVMRFRVGDLALYGGGGAQVKVGDGSNDALLECPDGKDMNQFLPSALNTEYVITLHIGSNGNVELWHRQKSPLAARGAPHASMTCKAPNDAGWLAVGTAYTTIDDVRMAMSSGDLIYK